MHMALYEGYVTATNKLLGVPFTLLVVLWVFGVFR